MDNSIQSPLTTNKPKDKTDVPNERQISLDILVETLKGFNILTLQSTISDSADDHSDQNDAESDPKIDQVVATHTSDGNERKVTATDSTKVNSPHKLLTNRKIPSNIPAVIPAVKQMTADRVAISGRAFHAVCAVVGI